ncbi:MAG: hypothetical protein IKP53_08560 [Candidatus Methanomethylophilaceae archaeon]|nr:hypothetical protein [Candidatus Methanomethylophilaceae archaeon]
MMAPALIFQLTNGWTIITYDLGVLDDFYAGEPFVRVESADGKINHVSSRQVVCVQRVANYVRPATPKPAGSSLGRGRA